MKAARSPRRKVHGWRQVGEALMIGDQVTVTVLTIKGSQVRLGVKAPRDVVVHREEVYERIKAEKNESGGESLL